MPFVQYHPWSCGVAKNLLCAWGAATRLIAHGGNSGWLGASVGGLAAKRVPLKRVAWAWPPGVPRSFSEGFRGVPGGSGGFRSGLGIMVIGRGQENVCFGAWGGGGSSARAEHFKHFKEEETRRQYDLVM